MADNILDNGGNSAAASSATPSPAPAASVSPSPAPAQANSGAPSPAPAPAPAQAKPSPAPAPSPSPAPAQAGRDKLLDNDPEGADHVPPADWPADWRIKLAGDDKKLLTQLERFSSPIDMAKKIREQDATITKLSSNRGLPKDATPEQITAYRKENNIPETPDKYDITLPDGLVVGEEDKPIIGNMLAVMHSKNLPNDVVKDILASYYQQEKQFLIDQEKRTKDNYKANDDTLRQDWGQEYRQNIDIIESLFHTFSEKTRAVIAGGFDEQGLPLKHNASFLREMAQVARTLNPIDTVVGGNGGNQMSSVEDEIKGIEARMGGIDPTYYKDEKAQKRLLQLYEWREKNHKK